MTHGNVGPAILEPLVLRRRDAARALGISTRAFDRLISSGEGPRPARLGRTPVWRVEVLRAWLAGREAGR